MARRLTGNPDLELPLYEKCKTRVGLPDICSCPAACGEEYCSPACRDAAAEQYHTMLCTGGNADHPLARLVDAWREMHHPPETMSITLPLRLLARAANGSVDLDYWCSVYEAPDHTSSSERVLHKLAEPEYRDRIEFLRDIIADFFLSTVGESSPGRATLENVSSREIRRREKVKGANVHVLPHITFVPSVLYVVFVLFFNDISLRVCVCECVTCHTCVCVSVNVEYM